jgi:hypothetical protein
MMRWLRERSILRAEVVLIAWLVVGGVAWADTLDLSDDLIVPLAGIQQALEPDTFEDLKASLNSVTLSAPQLELVSETSLTLSTCVPPLVSTLPRASTPPIYQVHCVYRI